MKDMNTKATLTLTDTTELRKMILEHPNLPLVIFAGQDLYDDEGAYVLAEYARCEIMSVACYNNNYVCDKEVYRETLEEYMAWDDKYENLSDDEFQAEIDKKMDEVIFTECIVVWVDR